jgi:hypothetical protein
MCPASEIRLSPPPAISGALTVFEAVNDRTLWQEISIKFDYLDAKHRLFFCLGGAKMINRATTIRFSFSTI